MNLMRFLAATLILLSATSALAQKLNVKVIKLQDNETEYTYVVPGLWNSYSNGILSCYGGGNVADCYGSSTGSGIEMPAHEVSLNVRGATLTLKLPDGRVVVVNCKSKFAERFQGPWGNRRSCRVPLVNNIQADFHGDKAKLIWVVSLNGKKKRSETYNILAVLGKPKAHTPAPRH